MAPSLSDLLGAVLCESISTRFRLQAYRGFPKIRGTFLGVLIIRTLAFGGLSWGTPIEGNYHLGQQH